MNAGRCGRTPGHLAASHRQQRRGVLRQCHAQIVAQRIHGALFGRFSEDQQKHFLLPSDTVERIDQVVKCQVSTAHLKALPPFHRQVSRQLEGRSTRSCGGHPTGNYSRILELRKGIKGCVDSCTLLVARRLMFL